MRTRQQSSRRRSQAASNPTPTRRSQRIAERNSRHTQSLQNASSLPLSAECKTELQAAMSRSRAKGRRRNAVVAESIRAQEPAPLPSRPAGLWDLLPPELLDIILDKCSAQQLAMLETACSFFRRTKLIQSVAESRLRAIPRAKGTMPDSRSAQGCSSAASPLQRRPPVLT